MMAPPQVVKTYQLVHPLTMLCKSERKLLLLEARDAAEIFYDYGHTRGSRKFRRQYGGGQGRRRRGNDKTHGSVRGHNNNSGYMPTNANRISNYGNSYAGGANGGRERGPGNQNSGRGGRGRGRSNGKNRHGRFNHCRNSTEHCWNDCSLGLSHQQQDET